MQSELDFKGVFRDFSCVKRSPVFPEEMTLKGRSTEIKPDWSRRTLWSPSCNKNSRLQFPLLKRFVNSVHSVKHEHGTVLFLTFKWPLKIHILYPCLLERLPPQEAFALQPKLAEISPPELDCVWFLFYVLSKEEIFTVLVILCDEKKPCCSVISLSVGHVSTTDGGELLMLFPSSF